MTLTTKCPAKINEFLLVGPKDDRGYHPLRSLFQTVALYDTLEVSTDLDEDAFIADAEIPAENTVVRAWNMLREFAVLPPIQVKLVKHIPMESGLGGGSSDAAGFLRAARQILGSMLSEPTLLEVAQAVGADVPFLVRGGRALGEGYGEKLTPVEPQEERWLVLAQPNVPCSTPLMYAKLDEISRPVSIHGRTGNDFELVAPGECLDLIEALRNLGSIQASLTGSGSAVFGYFASEAEARKAEGNLNAPWKQVVQTLPAIPHNA